MKRFCKLIFSCLFVLSTSLVSVFSQAADPAAIPAKNAGYALPPEIAEKRVAKLHADGLPLVEFVNLILVKEFPEVNFVMAPEMYDEQINLLQLRSVTLPQILTAIDIATKGKVKGTVVGDKLVSFTRGMQPADKPASNICQAFSLSGYLANRSSEETDQALKDLEDALKKCWQMLRDANPDYEFETPRLSLHRTTKLLIVVGAPDQLGFVSQLVSQLENGAQRELVMRPLMPTPAPVAPPAPRAPVAPQPPESPKAPAAPKAPVPPSTKAPASGK